MVVDVSPEGAKETEAIAEKEERVQATATKGERGFSDYLKPLGKHLLLIGLLMLLALVVGVIVWVLTFGSSPYQGEALVLFKPNANSQVDLSGNPQFSSITLDTNRQQSALLLMSSVDIAKEVQKRAATNSDRSIAALASEDPLDLHDSIDVRNRTTFISVTAQASTPAAATWLANTWADVGVTRVNETYAQPSANVDEALQQAKSQLDTDQKALEEFIASSQIITLTAQLSQTNAFINSAVTANANSSLVLYDAEQQSLRDQISNNYLIAAGLNQQINQLQALRTRVEQSPEDQASLYANQVSLLLLLNSVVAGIPASISAPASVPASGPASVQAPAQTRASAPAMQLQISITDVGNAPLSKNNELAEIDAAVSSIQGYQEEMSGQTAQLEKRLLSPLPTITSDQAYALSPTLQSYVKGQSQLRGKLEQEIAQQDQLQRTRDLDRNTYELLRSRLAEQNVNGVIGEIVAIGSAADEEQTVRSRSALRSLALDAGIGLVVALILSVGLAYLLSAVRPGFDSNHAIRRRIKLSRNYNS